MGIHGLNLIQIKVLEFLDIVQFGFTPVTSVITSDTISNALLAEDGRQLSTESGLILVLE